LVVLLLGFMRISLSLNGSITAHFLPFYFNVEWAGAKMTAQQASYQILI
jgi:hypothetical protein